MKEHQVNVLQSTPKSKLTCDCFLIPFKTPGSRGDGEGPTPPAARSPQAEPLQFIRHMQCVDTHTVLDQTMSCSVFSKVRFLRLVLWSQALVTMLQDGALLGSLPIFLLCFSSLYTGVWGICSVCPEKLSSALAVSLSVLSRGKLVLTSPSTPVTHVLRGAPGYNSWWWW